MSDKKFLPVVLIRRPEGISGRRQKRIGRVHRIAFGDLRAGCKFGAFPSPLYKTKYRAARRRAVDDLEFEEYLCGLNGEAFDLALRLGVAEFEGPITEETLYRIEKLYRVRLRAIRRFRRRAEAQARHSAEMIKTDEERAGEAEHARLVRFFMEEQGMSKLHASVAASGVIAMRKAREEGESEEGEEEKSN